MLAITTLLVLGVWFTLLIVAWYASFNNEQTRNSAGLALLFALFAFYGVAVTPTISNTDFALAWIITVLLFLLLVVPAVVRFVRTVDEFLGVVEDINRF